MHTGAAWMWAVLLLTVCWPAIGALVYMIAVMIRDVGRRRPREV